MSSLVEDISPNTTAITTPPTPPADPADHVTTSVPPLDEPSKLRLLDTNSRSPTETAAHETLHNNWAVSDHDQQKGDHFTPRSEFSGVIRGGVGSNGSARVRQNSDIFDLSTYTSALNGRVSEGVSAETHKELATSPEMRLRRRISQIISEEVVESKPGPSSASKSSLSPAETPNPHQEGPVNAPKHVVRRQSHERATGSKRPRNLTVDVGADDTVGRLTSPLGEPRPPRALSTPASIRSPSIHTLQDHRKSRAASRSEVPRKMDDALPRASSPTPVDVPLPPLSLSTCLQLELSSHRPSPMYIHRSVSSDFPYESSTVKIERLLNFLLLPFHLEGVMWFGVLGCLDAWLYVFTVLPLRMLKSMHILLKSWYWNINKEVRFVLRFVYVGVRRMWSRRQTHQDTAVATAPMPVVDDQAKGQVQQSRSRARSGRHHKRTKSTPSNLLPDDKADILKGLLIICTCLVLLRLDASRMYHWVRGQAAIKLYVIYNLLEVCDRQLSAIGQDVLECLFSQESLERKPNGHSKVLRPFWLFLLAWLYCVIHATALFYQVITMNVAVNSYSSALITLLMSNQFTEIKSTIFKKFEKENLFQLTCADIVERFQLWHMLMIIASRNIIETGALNNDLSSLMASSASLTAPAVANLTRAVPPRSASSVLPKSFMIVPEMLSSITSFAPTVAHVFGPFVIVLGSEMIIDWLKHAYVNKFNNTKPVLYDRFLDVLSKDYYVNAFGNQNLVKRLGLPVIPLSCLMIRAGFQTYQMFLASWVPGPSASTSNSSLADIHHHYATSHATPTSTAGLLVRKMDSFLDSLPVTISSLTVTSYLTVTLIILLLFLILLVIKLLLGMALLFVSRSRYQAYRKREQHPSWHIEGGKRFGGWGTVEVDDEKKRWFYTDDAAGYTAMKQREAREKAKKDKEKEEGYGIQGLEKVMRYEMVAKRIW